MESEAELSGIAGIIRFDGAPVDPSLIKLMTKAMAHRGPDGVHHWVSHSAAFGHCMLHTTPESLSELLPLASNNGSLYMTFDGRIDNRRELRRRLLGRDVTLRGDTDAELVLSSYETWGLQCPKYLEGDFALVIWDVPQQSAVCIRDRIGIKPFYYWWSSDTFVFASELNAILSTGLVPHELNQDLAVEYLTDSIRDREATLYRDIYRLPAATIANFSLGSKKCTTYWDVRSVSEVRYSSEIEYIEHFTELFEDSVRKRLRVTSPVGVLLSGGIDSSFVAHVSANLCKQLAPKPEIVEGFSVYFSGLDCDEQPSIEAFTNRIGMQRNVAFYHTPSIDFWTENIRYFRDFVETPTGAAYHPLYQIAREKGTRVLLGGWGADDWIGGGGGFYVDLVRRGGAREVCKRVRREARISGYRQAVKRVVNYGLRPLIPTRFKSALRVFKRARPLRSVHLSWMTEELIFRKRLRTTTAVSSRRNQLSHYKSGLYRWLKSGMFALNAELQERALAANSIDGRYPYNDHRVIEFMFAIPDRLKWGWLRPKHLLIESFKHNAPDLADHQFTDPEASGTYMRAIDAICPDRSRLTLSIEELKWVDTQAFHAWVDKVFEWYVKDDFKYKLYARAIWLVIIFDMWYQLIIQEKTGGEK